MKGLRRERFTFSRIANPQARSGRQSLAAVVFWWNRWSARCASRICAPRSPPPNRTSISTAGPGQPHRSVGAAAEPRHPRPHCARSTLRRDPGRVQRATPTGRTSGAATGSCPTPSSSGRAGQNRLHDRLRFCLQPDGAWRRDRLRRRSDGRLRPAGAPGRGDPCFMSTVAAWRTLPARPPFCAPVPARLHPAPAWRCPASSASTATSTTRSRPRRPAAALPW